MDVYAEVTFNVLVAHAALKKEGTVVVMPPETVLATSFLKAQYTLSRFKVCFHFSIFFVYTK